MNNNIMTGANNIGIGFLTSIRYSFCQIFGIRSKSFFKKQEKLATGFAGVFTGIRQSKPLRLDVTSNGGLSLSGVVSYGEHENKRYEIKVISASNNVGIGLWTAICRSFANFFGLSSKRFLDKQRFILTELESKVKASVTSNEDFTFVESKVVYHHHLAASMFAIIYREYIEVIKETPKVDKIETIDPGSFEIKMKVQLLEDYDTGGVILEKGTVGTIFYVDEDTCSISVIRSRSGGTFIVPKSILFPVAPVEK